MRNKGDIVKWDHETMALFYSGFKSPCLHKTGFSSAWLERLVWDQKVEGSNPLTPIKARVRVKHGVFGTLRL